MRSRDGFFRTVRPAAVGATLALVAFVATARAANESAASSNGSRTGPSRLDIKVGSRLADEAIGPERRLNDRRLSDERYLKRQRTLFRRERRLRAGMESRKRNGETRQRLRPRADARPESQGRAKAFELLFR